MANNMSATPGCMEDRTTLYLNTALGIWKIIFLLPSSILILHHAHQQWRQQRSFASASHSDVFTYHLSVIELLNLLGYLLLYWSIYTSLTRLFNFSLCLMYVGAYGELFFHVLTCVERYLAVVHPVIYQGLRNARGVKIRNISVACVWLAIICSVCGDLGVTRDSISIKFCCYMLLCLSVILFCSLSVVCALIRPPPGDFRKHGKKLSQSRKRALHMMLMILGVLCLSFLGYLIVTFHQSPLQENICLVMTCISWIYAPCSLVLPLLYLHRRGSLSWIFCLKMSEKR